MSALYHSLGFRQNQIGYFYMFFCGFIKGRSDYFCIHTSLHISHFLWSFIYQKNHHIGFWVICRDGIGNVFQEHSFPCFRLGYYHCSLSFSYWSE